MITRYYHILNAFAIICRYAGKFDIIGRYAGKFDIIGRYAGKDAVIDLLTK